MYFFSYNQTIESHLTTKHEPYLSKKSVDPVRMKLEWLVQASTLTEPSNDMVITWISWQEVEEIVNFQARKLPS